MIATSDLWYTPPPPSIVFVPAPGSHFVDFTIWHFDVDVGEQRHVTVWYTDPEGRQHHADLSYRYGRS